jgi:transposase
VLSLGNDERAEVLAVLPAPPVLPTTATAPCSFCGRESCKREEAANATLVRRKGGRAAPDVVLRTCEREELERVVRAGKSRQRDVVRARIVLFAAQGLTSREIARRSGLTEKAVGKWRRRFAKEGPKALGDAPRSGRPCVFTSEQKAWFFLKVLESARDNEVPIGQWTCAHLVEFAKRAGIHPTPDPATLSRWLKQADIQPHRWRYWFQITDPNFEARMKDVTGVYMRAIALAKAGIPVFCVDEKTNMQALRRERPDRPVRRGKIRRREHRYKRQGTTTMIGVFQVATGKVWCRFVESHKATTFVEVLAMAFDAESVKRATEIHIVMDQLSTHWHMAVCEFVAKASGLEIDPKKLRTGKQRKAFLLQANKRVVVHFTPTRASWLDQIEIWFSILARNVLAGESFDSVNDLQRKVVAFIEFYNRYLAHPFTWTYTGGPCRT